MTDGWIDRQLRRVREDYRNLPTWQQTAKSNDGESSRTDRPPERTQRDQPQQPRQEAKPQQR